jgi:hypothetical protein
MVFGPAGNRRSPPPSGMFLGSAGAAQTPNIDDLRPVQKPCTKNPSVVRPPQITLRGNLERSRGESPNTARMLRQAAMVPNPTSLQGLVTAKAPNPVNLSSVPATYQTFCPQGLQISPHIRCTLQQLCCTARMLRHFKQQGAPCGSPGGPRETKA